MGGWSIETLRPGELDAELRALWISFRAADPALRSPYFDLRYALAADDAAPGAEVAVIRCSGAVEGFLPFQRRGALIQPLAAPLTDYHGVVAAPGAAIDLQSVVAALGARRFRFSGLVGGQMPRSHIAVRRAMLADVSRGFDAYAARRPADFLKDKRRRARRLAEDHGALDFTFGPDPDGEAMDFILRLKRGQMRRTYQHDIFASPWTQGFLRRLAQEDQPDFGLRFAALRAGGRLVAAELGLRSGSAYHLWFPVYDPEFARYSPGALMTLETLRAAADTGLSTVDFGPNGEAYKADFAEPGVQVFEGDVTTGGVVETARQAANLAFGRAPSVRRSLSDIGQRLDRRWDRITACEPRLEGRVGAASLSLSRVPSLYPKTAMGLGAAVGLGVLGLIAD